MFYSVDNLRFVLAFSPASSLWYTSLNIFKFNFCSKPLTYTWAKMNGLGTMGCVLYSIYNATVAAITVFVVVFGALIRFVFNLAACNLYFFTY